MKALGEHAALFTLTIADLIPNVSDHPDGLDDPATVEALFAAASKLFQGPFFMVFEEGRGDYRTPGRGRLHVHTIAHHDDGPTHFPRTGESCKPVYDAVKLYTYLHKNRPYTLEGLSSYTASRVLYGKPPRTRRHFLGPSRLAWVAAHCTNGLTATSESSLAAAGDHTALAIDRVNVSPSTVAAIPQTAPQPSHDGLRARPGHLEGTARAAPRPRLQPATVNTEAPNIPDPAQRPARRVYEAPRRPPRHHLDGSRSSVPASTRGETSRTAHRRTCHPTETHDRTALRALSARPSTAPPHPAVTRGGDHPGLSP